MRKLTKLAERPCSSILVYHGNAQRRTSRGVDVDCGPPRIFWPEPSRRLAASGALCRMSQHLLLTSSVLSRDRSPPPPRVRHRGPRRAAAPPAGVRCTIHHSADSVLWLFAQRCSVGLNLPAACEGNRVGLLWRTQQLIAAHSCKRVCVAGQLQLGGTRLLVWRRRHSGLYPTRGSMARCTASCQSRTTVFFPNAWWGLKGCWTEKLMGGINYIMCRRPRICTQSISQLSALISGPPHHRPHLSSLSRYA